MNREIEVGDRVKVNWPTGKGGPYVYQGKAATYGDVSIVEIEGINPYVFVNSEWIESVEPEIEPDRLYYYWDNESIGMKNKVATVGSRLNSKNWSHVEPVSRRWDELSMGEKDHLRGTTGVGRIFLRALYMKMYRLITGEEHPLEGDDGK